MTFPRRMMFPSLRQALDYVVEQLIPRRHLYILDVYGGERLSKGRQSAIQIVDQHHVFNDGELGLTLHLSFDLKTCADYYAVFQTSPLKDKFVAVPWNGIPCFAAAFGTDVNAAGELAHRMLANIYFNADAMDLQYEVLDLGFWDDYLARMRADRLRQSK